MMAHRTRLGLVEQCNNIRRAAMKSRSKMGGNFYHEDNCKWIINIS